MYGNNFVFTRLHNLTFQKQHKNIFVSSIYMYVLVRCEMRKLILRYIVQRLEFCYTYIKARTPERNRPISRQKAEEIPF